MLNNDDCSNGFNNVFVAGRIIEFFLTKFVICRTKSNFRYFYGFYFFIDFTIKSIKIQNYYLDFVLFGYSPEHVQRVLDSASDKAEPSSDLRAESRHGLTFSLVYSFTSFPSEKKVDRRTWKTNFEKKDYAANFPIRTTWTRSATESMKCHWCK